MRNFEKYEEIILRHCGYAMGCQIKRLRLEVFLIVNIYDSILVIRMERV